MRYSSLDKLGKLIPVQAFFQLFPSLPLAFISWGLWVYQFPVGL